ncbi:hypothetical protein H310_09982 [Aphanomyces invadans]|uniref:Elicitin n=1 Tax=Aphanomyces invadans TaxID=157072 RepID=A0A024TV12_9STRA|nr:hypothetical protein H310_09982 [Aphanomyces invadans]ETV97187.1 hypothetical protein H310_09982 [Aphanomyces invadans]|eukprot:XP_008874433.1 hypothetical protein H310_09982 [Aphanomyces invadans]
MRSVAFFAIAMLAASTSAAECASNDLTPLLDAGIACIKAANLDMAALLSRDTAVMSKMCKHSECTTFFSKSQSLTCTVQGQPASLAAQACIISTARQPTLPLTNVVVVAAAYAALFL